MYKYGARIILALAVVLTMVAISIVGLRGSISLETISAGTSFMTTIAEDNFVVALVVFALIIALFTTVFTPGVLFLTLMGGYLFGTLAGALASNLGTALGSLLAFLIARYLLSDLIRARFKKKLIVFDRHLHREGIRYLLTVRLLPLIPAFVINLLAGLTKIRLRIFLVTTVVGNLPADFIYAYAGNRLHKISAYGDIFSADIILILTILGLASMLPLWYRRRAS